jgi:class III poly(R)-hydroxyalkanoic acid synthase PhaE subunit
MVALKTRHSTAQVRASSIPDDCAVVGCALTAVAALVLVMLAGAKPEQGINNYRELYDLWVECGEKVYAQVAHSEAYAKLQAQVGNAAIKLRAKQQAVIERGLKYFDLPTRAELNTVHKQMRELRERLASLEAQLAPQSNIGRERG